jgi:hypothetical protein
VRQAGPGDSLKAAAVLGVPSCIWAHNAQGQKLNKIRGCQKSEDFNTLPAVSALARVLINVANVMSFPRGMVAWTRGLESNEDEIGNDFAKRGQKAVAKRSDICRQARLLEGSACLH